MKKKSYESLIKSLNEGLNKAETRVAEIAGQYAVSTDKAAWAREAKHAREMVETWKDWIENAQKANPAAEATEAITEVEEETSSLFLFDDTIPYDMGMEM